MKLEFTWFAIFKDGIQINQFDKDEKEHRFQEVKDKFEDLLFFSLTNNKGKLFTIDLKQGMIGYNYLTFPYIKSKEAKKNNIRLIFFRRHMVSIGTSDLKEKFHTITYHLGYQYNDKNNNNQKIILKIDKEGNFILGE